MGVFLSAGYMYLSSEIFLFFRLILSEGRCKWHLKISLNLCLRLECAEEGWLSWNVDSYCFSCLGIQLLGLGIRICNGGQAKQLTLLESWILGEGGCKWHVNIP